MKTKIKKQISKSLKSYHKHKQVIADCKAVAGFALLIATASILIQLAIPIVLADNTARYTFLPKNPDKKNLTVKEQIRKIAREENFEWTDYLLRLGCCESSLKQNARNDNGYYKMDRGVFQINSFFHPEVSDECADNILCATKWTMWMINSGRQHEWVCNDFVLNNSGVYDKKCNL